MEAIGARSHDKQKKEASGNVGLNGHTLLAPHTPALGVGCSHVELEVVVRPSFVGVGAPPPKCKKLFFFLFFDDRLSSSLNPFVPLLLKIGRAGEKGKMG